MATNRFPLIVDPNTQRIRELPSGDNLDLTNSSILNANTVTTTGDMTVGGDLTVEGEITAINSNILTVDDKNIVVAAGAIDAVQADGGGLTIDGADATFTYESATDSLKVNKPFIVDGTINTGHGDNNLYPMDQGVRTIDSVSFSDISETDITVSAGSTLDVSNGTLDLADNQINGNVINGGTATPESIETTNLTVDSLVLHVDSVNDRVGVNTAAPEYDLDVTGDIRLTGSLLAPATFTIDPAAFGDDTGKVVIAGDLQVDGTTTTINSTELTVNDLTLTLASGAGDPASADGAGLIIDGAGASLTYSASFDGFVFNKDVSITGDFNISGQAELASLNVEDLTAGRVLLAGTDGEIEDSGNLTFDGTDLTVTGNETVTGDLVVDTDTLVVNSSDNHVGIGTSSPSERLSVSENFAGSTRVEIENTDPSGTTTLRFSSDDGAAAAIYDNASDSFTLQNAVSGGTFRIQTTDTANQTGNAISIDSDRNVTFVDGDVTADNNVSIASDLTVDTNTLFVDSANSRVGIGISSPAEKLDVDGNIQTTGTLYGPSTFTIDPSAHGDNTGKVVIAGDLQIDGTTTTINSSTLSVDDKNIVLAAGASSTTEANGAGITIDGADATIEYNSGDDSFVLNKAPYFGANRVLTTADEGSGNGIDADTLDGQEGTYYLDHSNFTNVPNGTLTVEGGNGIDGSGTFSADQASNATITLSHNDTSTQSSVSLSAGNVINKVTLDTYGHVTQLDSVNLDGRYYTETESDNRFINVTGDTMSGLLTLSDDPSQTLHAATKRYVDEVASGLQSLPSAKAATTTDLNATYANGSGTATLTGSVDGAFPTIDGISISVGENVLVKDQSNKYENGSYVLTDAGSASSKWVLTRCDFCNETDEVAGAFEFVTSGDTQESTGWVATVPSDFVIGSTDPTADTSSQFTNKGDIVWAQFSGSGTYTAGTGLEFGVDGRTFNHVNAITPGTIEDSGGTRTLGYSDSFVVPTFSYDGQGHISGIGTASTITMPSDPRGLFSASGDLAYNSSTGEFSVTTYKDADVESYLSGGTGVAFSGGVISIGQPVGTSDNVTFNDISASGDVSVTGSVTGSLLDIDNIRVDSNTISATNTDGDVLLQPDGSGRVREVIGGVEYNLVSARDIGTDPNEVPVNGFLGNLAYIDTDAIPSILIDDNLLIRGSSETNTSSTTQTIVSSFDGSAYGSGKIIVQIHDTVSGERQVSEILLTHDGTNGYLTEYGVVFTGSAPLAVFDVNVTTEGVVQLLGTSASGNSTNYTVTENLIGA